MNMDTNKANQAAASAASQAAAVARQKRLKAGTACTNCRKKKLRCTGTPNCARCVTHKLDCVVDEALFLKTNSAKSLFAKTAAGTRLSTSLSSSNNNINASSSTSAQRLDQQKHAHPYHPVSHSKHQQQQFPHPSDPYYPRDHGSSSSGGSGDEMMDAIRHDPYSFHTDRRMSGSSMTSLSSLSPGPSSPSTFGHNSYPPLGSSSSSSNYYPKTNSGSRTNATTADASQTSAGKASKSRPPAPTISIPNAGATESYSSPSTSSAPVTASKKRASKDQGSTKLKQKRTNSKAAADTSSTGPGLDADPCSPTFPLQDSSKSTKKNGEQKSVVSTMSLDGHGQQ
ncbi:hypothetical protein KI688_002429 [Linnemannia hyalina]|uniref:Zn(2)-C6 fungal-type domain-containing protein n=1 Tax=Linnemannia hyalina TaxID=64524 RepID=A0A9P8BRC4_9FUNG|nr:hypothetical protein KI688_002429 [Linnemannia hyalina]